MTEDLQEEPHPSARSREPREPRGIAARRARAAIFAGSILFVGLVTYQGFFFCPTARYLHFPCPACGSLRALHAIADLDFTEALRTNPIAPFVSVLLAAIVARASWLFWSRGSARDVGDGRVGNALVRSLGWCFGLELFVWAMRMFGLFGGPVNV